MHGGAGMPVNADARRRAEEQWTVCAEHCLKLFAIDLWVLRADAVAQAVKEREHTLKDMVHMTCEAHPWLEWPHDDCAGPGMPVSASLSVLAQHAEEIARLNIALRLALKRHGVESEVAALELLEQAEALRAGGEETT